jgi:hypothetical protein
LICLDGGDLLADVSLLDSLIDSTSLGDLLSVCVGILKPIPLGDIFMPNPVDGLSMSFKLIFIFLGESLLIFATFLGSKLSFVFRGIVKTFLVLESPLVTEVKFVAVFIGLNSPSSFDFTIGIFLLESVDFLASLLTVVIFLLESVDFLASLFTISLFVLVELVLVLISVLVGILKLSGVFSFVDE